MSYKYVFDNIRQLRYISLGAKMKAITLKLEDQQLRLLDEVSKATHIPKSAPIRQGIDLVLRQTKEDILSAGLRGEIDQLLKEDQDLLKRLAKA